MTSPNVTFVYCPRSGDRVFAEKILSQEVQVVKWPNNSRHIVGGVALSYCASVPGQYWRGQARTAAQSLISAGGGVAWDEQGSINLVVPLSLAYQADQVMRAARGAATGQAVVFEDENRANEARMLLSGVTYLTVDEYGFGFKAEPTRRSDQAYTLVRQDDGSYSVMANDEEVAVIRYKDYTDTQTEDEMYQELNLSTVDA